MNIPVGARSSVYLLVFIDGSREGKTVSRTINYHKYATCAANTGCIKNLAGEGKLHPPHVTRKSYRVRDYSPYV